MQLSGRGMAFSIGASVLFAVLPGYVSLLHPLDGLQIFAQRVLWSIPFVLLLLWLSRQGAPLRAAFARLRDEPLLWLACPAAALLMGVQWWLFMWAPLSGYMLDVSMGFFLLPLVMVLAGRVVYGERLRPFQQLAVLCAFIGVAHELWRTQAFSWPTLVTALGYPPYFILRRWMRFEALPGFIIELLFMAPVAIALIWLFGSMDAYAQRPELWLLVPGMALVGTLAFSGMMIASRLLPLGLFGILNYLEPVLLFFVALLLLREPFSAAQWYTYVPIWLAVLLVGFDSARLLRKQRLLT